MRRKGGRVCLSPYLLPILCNSICHKGAISFRFYCSLVRASLPIMDVMKQRLYFAG